MYERFLSKKLVLFIALTVSVILSLNFITQKNSKETTTETNSTKNFDIQSPDSSKCTKTIEIWKFDHYETVPGKIVGIWPEEATFIENPYKLKIFHDTLGINSIYTYSSYLKKVISAGYDRNHIMIGGLFCEDPFWKTTILSTKPVWAYYIDEQGQHYSCDIVKTWFNDVRQFMNNNGASDSKIIAGETTPDDFDCYHQFADTMMCTWYGYNFWPLTNDQRNRWGEFQKTWPNKFKMTWVSSRLDYDEFDRLISRANTLELSGIWLFQADDDKTSESTERNRIDDFCLYAWKWGYLKRIDRKWISTFTCSNQNPCNCNPKNLSDGWILQSEHPTNETKNVLYVDYNDEE